jgi:hypothetical protein
MSRLIPATLFCAFCHFVLIAVVFSCAYEVGVAQIDGGDDVPLARSVLAVLAFPLGCLVLWAKVDGPLGMVLIVLNSLLWGLCLAWLARTFAYVHTKPHSWYEK